MTYYSPRPTSVVKLDAFSPEQVGQLVELTCLPDMIDFYRRWGFDTDTAGTLFMRREERRGPA